MKKTSPIVFLILIFLIFFHLVSFQVIFGQSVVISEYYNASSVYDEWTELVVVGDDISLVGYKLRDNVGTGGVPNEWMGGVEFVDSPLWKNLRRGTIIVIDHRGSGAADVNKTDGFIEVDAENPDYFVKRCWGCDLNFDWTTKALVVAQSAEIIQILDENNNNVHALGHMAASSGDFPGIIGPKSSYKGTISGNTSVRIAPGTNLADYNAGFDINAARTFASGQFITKGLPNMRNASDNRNGEFWKSLRQPEWDSPILQASNVVNGIKLDWNELTIPNPGGDYHGYTILRSLSAKITADLPIEDGTFYGPGQKLDNWTVVTNVNGAENLTYTDTASLGCSAEHTYYIYGFRYGSDIARNNEAPLGRAYNEQDFGEASIVNVSSDSVRIYTKDGRTKFCSEDTVMIYSDITGDSYVYSWRRNNAIAGDKSSDSLKVTKMGKKNVFWLEITSKKDSCVLWSNKLEITFETEINAKLYKEDGKEVWYDETIRLCTGEEYELLATSKNSDRIDWHKDGSLLIPNKESITVTESGTYYAIASLNDECFDTTKTMKVIFQDYDFTVEDKSGDELDTLRFYLYGNNNSEEKDLVIKNNSKDTLVITKDDVSIKPSGFYSIVLPFLPFIIPPGDLLALRVRYESSQPGKMSGKLIFNAPCDSAKEIILMGEKLSSDITQSDTLIDFGRQINCNTQRSQRELTITTYGNKQFKFFEPIVPDPFFLISPSFKPPIELAGGSDLIITLGFNSSIVSTYVRTLEIPYQSDGKDSTLKVVLTGRIFDTKFKFRPDTVNFRTLLDCESEIDTTVFVYNIGDSALIFNKPAIAPNISFQNTFPLNILPGDSAELEIIYTPQGIGEAFSIEFTANPCLQTEPYLYITGSREGNAIVPEADSVEFGTFADCDFPSDQIRQTFLTVKDNLKDFPYIDSVGISGNFSTDLQKGRVLDLDMNYYNVTLLPGPPGVYEGELTIKYAPCGIVKIIKLHGNRAEPMAAFEDSVDFGISPWSADTTVDFRITNIGDIPITINNIVGLSTPFSLNQSVYSLPLPLDPQQSGTLQFDYVKNGVAKDTLEIFLDIEPCGKSEQAVLFGEVSEGAGGNLAMDMPGKVSGRPGDIVTLPISLIENEPLILSETEVNTINFTLNFNPSILYVNNVTLGTGLNPNIVSGLQFSENPIGQLNIDFGITDPLLLSGGNWLDVKFMALVGNSMYSVIRAKGSVSSRAPVTILTDSTDFELINDCPLDSVKIAVGGNVAMTVNVLQFDEIKIDYSIVTDDPTSIVLYNSLGSRVRELFTGHAKPGSHSVTASINDLSVGVYFVVMHSGISQKFRKFIIVR